MTGPISASYDRQGTIYGGASEPCFSFPAPNYPTEKENSYSKRLLVVLKQKVRKGTTLPTVTNPLELILSSIILSNFMKFQSHYYYHHIVSGLVLPVDGPHAARFKLDPPYNDIDDESHSVLDIPPFVQWEYPTVHSHVRRTRPRKGKLSRCGGDSTHRNN